MIHLKSLLLESKNQSLIELLIEKLKPMVDEMVDESKKEFEEKFNRPMKPIDEEYSRLNIIYDMVSALEKYTKPDDTLISFNARGSVKNNIEISAIIERDNNKYSFVTSVIYAGGYNIQVLHYRYIVKTKLPKTNNAEITSVYKNKLKRMSKVESLRSQRFEYEELIKDNEEKIANAIKLSDNDILNSQSDDKKRIWNTTWEEIQKRDAAKNFNNSEEEYFKWVDTMKRQTIESFKKLNIKYPTEYIKMYQNNIKKIDAKLNALK